MSAPVKRLNVNNIKNNIASKGLAPDRIIAYFLMFIIAYVAFNMSKFLGISISYWVASIGFPTLFAWYLLFILTYENQPYYQLIPPFINFIGFGNKRKAISESGIDVVRDSVLINKSNQKFIGLLKVYPKNIFTLKEEDRIMMTQKMATDFLNNIRGKKFELVLRNRTATVSDYKDYFDYYLEMSDTDLNRLTDQTREHLKIHLLEVEGELNKGYLKFKELYLEVYMVSSGDDDLDNENIEDEMQFFIKLLSNIDIKSRHLDRIETEQYRQKFILFKSSEELVNEELENTNQN